MIIINSYKIVKDNLSLVVDAKIIDTARRLVSYFPINQKTQIICYLRNEFDIPLLDARDIINAVIEENNKNPF